MRKKITIALIILIIINTLSPNFIFSSGLGTLKDVQEHQAETGTTTVEELIQGDEAPVTPDNGSTRKEKIEVTNTQMSFLGASGSVLIMIPAKVVGDLMQLFVYTFQGDDAEYKMKSTDEFTIENLVLGKYSIFDINYFTMEGSSEEMSTVKANVSSWHYALRKLAIVIGLFVLIYVGIRMAISTLAEDKAKYKKMFIAWVTSIILIFVMPYIAIVLLKLQDILLELINGTLKGQGFEEVVVKNAFTLFTESTGFNKASYLILYYMLIYYQVKFFLMYFKRCLTVGFLITVAPLVTVTYSIDKAGDGKAQAFGNWLRELIFNIFIQVLHAMVYVIFIYSAAEIAIRIPMLGVLFLMALSKAEKIVRNTFALKGKGIAEEKPLDFLKGK